MKGREVVETMMKNDAFSQWLGIEIIKVEQGHVILEMKTRAEMLNGFSILHGGITYSLADSALAFAANTHGIQSVSIETSISHTKPVRVNETIRAIVTEKNLSKRIGIYDINILNEKEETVALFKGTMYRTGKEW
jgi:acyl-CoA thioesterase